MCNSKLLALSLVFFTQASMHGAYSQPYAIYQPPYAYPYATQQAAYAPYAQPYYQLQSYQPPAVYAQPHAQPAYVYASNIVYAQPYVYQYPPVYYYVLAPILSVGVQKDALHAQLINAINEKHHDEVLGLIASKANIERPDRSGVPPLYYAARSNDEKLARILLEAGARVDCRSKKNGGDTPLSRAVYEADGVGEGMINLLCEFKANVNCSRDDNITTPLFLAAESGSEKLVRRFIEVGAHVDGASEDEKYMPLYIAAGKGYTAITRLLANAKAHISPDILPVVIGAGARLEEGVEQRAKTVKTLMNHYFHQLNRKHLLSIYTIKDNSIEIMPVRNGCGLHMLSRDFLELYMVPHLAPQALAAFRAISKGCNALGCSEHNKRVNDYIKRKQCAFIEKGLVATQNKNGVEDVIAVLANAL